jgi:hypothetical protein
MVGLVLSTSLKALARPLGASELALLAKFLKRLIKKGRIKTTIVE